VAENSGQELNKDMYFFYIYSRTTNRLNKNELEIGTLSTEPPSVTPSQALSSAGDNTVQLLLRMPDGKLLQLSALPVEHVTPSGANQLLPQSQVCHNFTRYYVSGVGNICRFPNSFLHGYEIYLSL
jgi:hypothetical protein